MELDACCTVFFRWHLAQQEEQIAPSCCMTQQRCVAGAAASVAAAFVQGQEKMSKSDPNSAIFMEDSKEDVDRKIKKAFCPPNVVQGNPCLKYIQLIILPWSGTFTVTFSKEGGREKCVVFPSMTCLTSISLPMDCERLNSLMLLALVMIRPLVMIWPPQCSARAAEVAL